MTRVRWLLPASPAQGGSGDRGDVNHVRGEPAPDEATHSRHRCDSMALDASITHLDALGMRRHIRVALKLGAIMEQVMEVLQRLSITFQNK